MRAGGVCETEPGCVGETPVEGYAWTVLQRHGRRPLLVLARSLLRADNRCAGLAFWSRIELLETAGQRYAVSVCHDQAWCDAWLCDSVETVRRGLVGHDPAWALPSGAGEAVARFRGAWAGLLAALLGRSA